MLNIDVSSIGQWLIALLLVLVAAVLLRRWFRASTKDVDSSPVVAGLPRQSQVLELLAAERDKARRLNYPVTVMVLASSAVEAGEEVAPPIPVELAQRIAATMRDLDIVGYDSVAGRAILVLPGVDTEHAARTLTRINELVAANGHRSLVGGVAQFPQDAVLPEDLYAVAGSRLSMTPVSA